MLQRVRIGTGDNRWYEYLPDVVYNYNHTYHSTIDAIPVSVFNGTDVNNQKIVRVQSNIKIGDLVRTIEKRQIFTKGDAESYSREIYQVIGKQGGKYRLKDIDTGEEVDKLFKLYEIKRINEIVENRPENDREQREVVRENRRKTQIEKQLNRENIRQENILSNRRVRKDNRRDEYDYNYDDDL